MKRAAAIGALLVLWLVLAIATANAGHKPDHEQDHGNKHKAEAEHEGQPAHGCDQAAENDGDTYDSTCDGTSSPEGAESPHGDGTKGAADNKNPNGQAPNGSEDGNNGYECDGNQGHPNPAHTDCASPAPTGTPPTTCTPGTTNCPPTPPPPTVTPSPTPSDSVLPLCIGDRCDHDGSSTRYERDETEPAILPATGANGGRLLLGVAIAAALLALGLSVYLIATRERRP